MIFSKKKITIENLESKYIQINPILSLIIQNKLQKNFNLFKIKDEKHTFDYFDSIVIWNIFNYFIKYDSNISNIKQYFNIYEKLVKSV